MNWKYHIIIGLVSAVIAVYSFYMAQNAEMVVKEYKILNEITGEFESRYALHNPNHFYFLPGMLFMIVAVVLPIYGYVEREFQQ